MAEDPPLLALEDVACWFDVSPPLLSRLLEGKRRATLRAVDGVSFSVRHGSTFSIVGESGCGKSTVARLVVGLYRPTRGRITLGTVPDERLGRRRPRIQMIFQDPYASLNPRWRVEDIISEPIRELGLARGAEVAARVRRLLGQVGLAASDGARYPHEFSGGQRQRISIARALATEADLLVCDEPTSALDVSVQAQILNLMRALQDELGLTYLFISHNLSVIRHMSDEIAVMYLGRIVEQAATEALFESPQHPYTRLLVDTIPDLEEPNRDRSPMGGEVPSPIAPPPGCSFHPRCPLVMTRCRIDTPDALFRADGALVRCHAVSGGEGHAQAGAQG